MAKMTIEVEVELTGRFEKGDRSVGEGDGYEDVEIEDIYVVRSVREPAVFSGVPRYRQVRTRIQPLPVEVRNAFLEALDPDLIQEALRDAE